VSQITLEKNFEYRLFKNTDYLTPEREAELFQVMRGGDKRQAQKARDIIIMTHLRLAHTLVLKKVKRIKSASIERMDLFQEAVSGLCMAIDRFDTSHGTRFSTYAKFWIEHNVDEYLRVNNLVIKLPNTIYAKRIASFYVYSKTKIISRHPEGLEQSELLRLIAEDLNAPLDIVRNLSIVLDSSPVQFDAPVKNKDGDENVSILDAYSDTGPSPEQVVIDTIDLERQMLIVNSVVSNLKPRERDIYEKRILGDETGSKKLDYFAEKYNISRERVRQIEKVVRNKITNALMKARKRREI